MNIRTTPLKLVTIMIDFFVIFFGFALTMGLTSSAKNQSLFTLQITTSISLYLACTLIFAISFYLFRIFHLIDIHNFFSDSALIFVKTVRYLFIALFIVLLGIMPFVYYTADHGDAPGLIFIVMGIVFIPLAIAVFISAMEKILNNSINLKKENELTI